MNNFFDELLKRPAASAHKPEPDFDVAFGMWRQKQAFNAKLPTDGSAKITISVDQLLALMRESYKAGYRRAQ